MCEKAPSMQSHVQLRTHACSVHTQDMCENASSMQSHLHAHTPTHTHTHRTCVRRHQVNVKHAVTHTYAHMPPHTCMNARTHDLCEKASSVHSHACGVRTHTYTHKRTLSPRTCVRRRQACSHMRCTSSWASSTWPRAASCYVRSSHSAACGLRARGCGRWGHGYAVLCWICLGLVAYCVAM